MENKPLMFEIRQTSQEWRQYMHKMASEIGIPSSYRQIIVQLERNPGMSQKELAENCQITRAAVSQIVREMEQSGYVRKETDARDRRYTKLFLTPACEFARNQLHEKLHETDLRLTEAISPEKEEQVKAVLAMIRDILRKI